VCSIIKATTNANRNTIRRVTKYIARLLAYCESLTTDVTSIFSFLVSKALPAIESP
jgi:hypothetical protein